MQYRWRNLLDICLYSLLGMEFKKLKKCMGLHCTCISYYTSHKHVLFKKGNIEWLLLEKCIEKERCKYWQVSQERAIIVALCDTAETLKTCFKTFLVIKNFHCHLMANEIMLSLSYSSFFPPFLHSYILVIHAIQVLLNDSWSMETIRTRQLSDDIEWAPGSQSCSVCGNVHHFSDACREWIPRAVVACECGRSIVVIGTRNLPNGHRGLRANW